MSGSETVYISTQGSVPHTVNDFWRMVWEQRSNVILMLTAFRERDRVKSDAYWSETPSTIQFGVFAVTLVQLQHCGDVVHRKFELRNTSVSCLLPLSLS